MLTSPLHPPPRLEAQIPRNVNEKNPIRFYGALSDALKLAQQIESTELYKTMLDVHAGALEMARKHAELQDEISRLTERVAELEGSIAEKRNVVRYHELYFDADERGAPTGYAYCFRCFEVEKRLIHIARNPIEPTMSTCPHCHSHYDWWGRADRISKA
jgi:hypothetical protein